MACEGRAQICVVCNRNLYKAMSLWNDTMIDVYTLARIKSKYPVDDSRYSPRRFAADYIFQSQSNKYAGTWEKERYVLY